MHKKSTSWLIVRILGLISLAIASYQLYEYLVNVSMVVAQLNSGIPLEGTLRLINLRWDPFVGFIFFSALSLYFLKFGSKVHGWLMSAGGGKSENS